MKPKPYNTFPHYISNDYLDDKLQRNEWILLAWLRSIADPLGIVRANETALRDDMFPDVEVNTITQLLRSLRKKGYIKYENHRGKRKGTFRIELDEWLLKGRTLRRYSEQTAEVTHKLDGQTHKSDDENETSDKGLSSGSDSPQVISHHIEQDNDNEKDTETSSSTPVRKKRTWKEIPTDGFRWKDDNEKRCLEIAIEVGEDYMDFILTKLKDVDDDIRVIEDGFERWQKVVLVAERKFDDIRYPARMFNKCLRDAVDDYKDKKSGGVW